LRRFKVFKSLRVRLFLIILTVALVPSLMMRYAIVENYQDKAVSMRTATVQSQLKILANHLIYYNYLSDSNSETINAELEMLSNLYDGRVLIIGGNFKVVKDTYGISEGRTMIAEEVIRCFNGESVAKYSEELGYIEMTTPITENVKMSTGDGEEERVVVRGVMLTGISDESIVSIADVLRKNAFILETLLVLMVVGIALILSNMLVKPFERVTQSINNVKEGYSREVVSVGGYTETAQIVEAFNQLLDRMKILDESRQEFVANVSHELKTPMAAVKVLADSLLGRPDAPVELYREFLRDIASQIDRENQIITDLLALVKMEKKEAALNISTVNMNELTELVLKRLRPIARKYDIGVVFESARQVNAEVDEVKITQIITNLVENAIKYNHEHGQVRVVLDADHQNFILEVQDSGIGIPKEALPKIYERFYRVDKSHSREIGGTGLGLAITKNAVLMHKGSITVSSKEGEGTSFCVKIPLIYLSDNISKLL